MLQSADQTSETRLRWLQNRHHRWAVGAMLLLMIAIVSLTAYRVYLSYSSPSNEFDWSHRGYSDFHNGTYFPTRAFVDGKSPYSTQVAQEYQMCRATPPYSPVVFLLHIPFALLPLEIARVLFFVFNFSLIGCLAYFSLKMSKQEFRWFDFLAITNLLLLSRPGHVTLFTGYFTIEIVIGCIVALHFAKNRPAVSGWGLVLASIKPNFVIPLILLMIFRKNFLALVYGILFCAACASIGLGWLSYHNGFEQVVADVRGGQEALHIDPTEMPVNTWTRVDLLGMYAKIVDWVPDDKTYLVAMLICIPIVGFFVWRIAGSESNSGATGLSAVICVLTLLLSLYHHSYDCLLLAVPAIGLLFFGANTIPEIPQPIRMIVAILLSVPAINYVSTKSVLALLSFEPLSVAWQSVTLINGVCLLTALIILLLAPQQNIRTSART